MGIGTDLRTELNALREEFGSECALGNGEIEWTETLSVKDLTPEQIKTALGDDYSDEVVLPWADFEASPGGVMVAGGTIKVNTTGESWIVRRVSTPMLNNVIVAERYLCIRKTESFI